MSFHDELSAPLVSSPAPQLMGVERGCVGVSGGGSSAVNGGVPPAAAAAAAAGEEPPRKRIKQAKAASDPEDGHGDGHSLRRRILECDLVRLRALRDQFTDQLSELYFLQAGGNMMDYAVWRKRPPTPQLAAFLEARRPAGVGAGAGAAAAVGVGAAVAATSNPADEMVEKARAEAYVAGRVAELARAGLWAERRLPRVMDPPRAKSHWDYLLEEMTWLAQDFAHERKWKKQAAKKCARAVQKYFQDKALAAQKAEKAQELQLRKIAAFAAKEIRTFWSNVEKLVEWKRVRRVERARKQALDEQLSYIVDRTERYSRQLAANLAEPVPHPAHSAHPASDDEFTPRGCSDDDEETIAAAEREAAHDAAHHRLELDALRRESRQALGDLLPPGYTPSRERAAEPEPEYAPSGDDSADDERTIADQERIERHHDPAELDDLRRDADLDLADLVRRYAAVEVEVEEESSSEVESSSSSSSSSALEALMESEEEGGVEAAAVVAASLQPTGTTLQEMAAAVGTPVPRLLRHALREYQHVGLHWLATMYARGLNGILADEMGLGKTIQTIALLAHLAVERHEWGPHLVVAPTSVVLNWEMEFKKWCPAFKILTYYGTIKERKLKRVGWTKANSFHVCITSYKLVVQDHQSFRRKRWKYLILDEAQNIKNFKSQRWQMLLNFQTERRLLLTGTPLQNSLVELWSLMHFLMPAVFASHSEFREWFSSVAGMAAGMAAGGGDGGGADGGEARSRHDEALVRRLHEVLRPFLLRRLKQDVERQMPTKYEHVLLCRLANRQRYLYDDFMARAKTRESLASGNLLSVINVLMQLRKVCNHPDLFEPRPVCSPLHLPPLRLHVPALALLTACRARLALAARLGGDLATLEAAHAGAFAAHRARHLAPPRRLLEDAARRPPPVPRLPPAPLRLHLRLVPRAAVAASPPPPHVAPHGARVEPPSSPAPAPAPRPPAAPGGGAAAARLEARRRAAVRRLASGNERRCWRLPLYGADLRAALCAGGPPVPPRDIAHVLHEMHDIIDRFTVCWRACLAGGAELCVGRGAGAAAWRRACAPLARRLRAAAAPLQRLLHAPASRAAVAFPHPRLLQYDCGKLQTLALLLRQLKAGGHRVLIFTQMTRVLDVLEGFLSLHGHAYLRLDGATRLERRQQLVERFNADRRVFAFILSTRSGGVGLNLTGADSVVFYDSDWNPTMDAQAQDRCHRIGQTRDVHVYRLVTAATVEENILRKAAQKRALGDLAIDAGHFTTSYLQGVNIRELFGSKEAGAGEGAGESEVGGAGGGDLELALAAAEDEADAAAAHAARAEAQGDLAEFDETQPLPLDDEPEPPAPAAPAADPAADPAAGDLVALMNQLSPIEKYAMRVVESSEAATEAESAALGEMRRQLHEWEEARRLLRDSPSPPPPPHAPHAPHAEPHLELTYSREDSRAQEWVSAVTSGGQLADHEQQHEPMPMWCPPTPPSGDGDVYCETWSRALYRPGAAADCLLPACHRREPRAPRDPRRARALARAPHAPPSLFERAGARPRPRARPAPPPHPHPHPHPHAPQPDWAPAEDAALRRALRLQRLPADPPPALAPNWDWVAEAVGEAARAGAYRAPRACRDRHDALADPERARRRHRRPPAAARHARRHDDDAPRPPLPRLDAMRAAADARRHAPKRRLDDPPHANPKHAQLLADHGLHYDDPPTPMEVATRRADRIAKEKLKAGAAAPSAAATAAAAPPPAPAAAPPQRIVVAAHAVAGAAKAEAGRRAPVRPPGAGPSAAAAAGAQLVYRQHALAPRHLKILHQGAAAAAAGVGVGVGGALQLQQLALRRGGTHAHAQAQTQAHSHVVVAHLAAPAATPPTTRAPDSRQ